MLSKHRAEDDKAKMQATGRLEVAEENGYTQQTLKAPIIIVDGFLGLDYVEMAVDGKHLKSVKVAKAIAECDAVFAIHTSSCTCRPEWVGV